ncbi:hypothetical protein [Mesomycoplasma ovipneumoniae]|uniref:hypothetical protein n=1 Tax=Mesomycoplasma ovipneumoniae TaxID=29562 RepID=UPI0028A5E72B|nr:hypothetical protein [Mesomycoplasma ovipneumoniae]WNM14648.1 hypothetical protein RNM01_02775 [Mesomycoplasma ovipneumoniae]
MLKPISTTNVNLSVELKNQKQADSIADVPFMVRYKKSFLNMELIAWFHQLLTQF